MVKSNSGLDDVRIFSDNAAMLGRTNFDEHVEELDEVLTRMETSGPQANIQKRKWAVQKSKCLGCTTTPNGHSMHPKNMQGLVHMKHPKNKRQVRRFLGGVNFFHKMWRN